MIKYILGLIYFLSAPQRFARHFDELDSIAVAIDNAALTHEDARLLVALHFLESGFRFNHFAPFGLTEIYPRNPHHAPDIATAGTIALRSWRHAYRVCHTTERAFAYYASGRCTGMPAIARLYAHVYISLPLPDHDVGAQPSPP